MTNSTQRIVLLTGASLAALAFANPAQAASTITPFPPSAGYPIIAPTINDLLIISLITDPPATYGDTETGDGFVSAGVTSSANGEIRQSGTATAGPATFAATNAGVVTVNADASASGTLALQTAAAVLVSGFYQNGQATGDSTLTLDNSGSLTLAALAHASGDTAKATAVAVGGGRQQATSSNGNASVATTNSGTLTVNAFGTAIASVGNAGAAAVMVSGFAQHATASGNGTATVALTNTSTGLIIERARAIATATNSAGTGGNANATAVKVLGVNQSASATGGFDASDALTNDGTIFIYSDAFANADFLAKASAVNVLAVSQKATASGGGDASTLTANSGTIDLRASAHANGATATANANLVGGIVQSAQALSSTTNPTASSTVTYPSGNALAQITNASTGVINITALATAFALGGQARASATATNGISQVAHSVDGTATVGLTNAGTLLIGAKATAIQGNFTTPASAHATAQATNAIVQSAQADNGAAAVTLDNSGTLTISADAQAVGFGLAVANATLGTSGAIISQTASSNGALASVDLTNSGTLNITNHAIANGAIASAYASGTSSLIRQDANGVGIGGDASVNITNSSTGVLSMAFQATAHASQGNARASASLDTGISQNANSALGDATATLTNSGTLNITALANATASNVLGTAGSAFASATASDGLSQNATASGGGLATTTLDNSGTFTVAATANAVADAYASANANVSSGITQDASANGGGDAIASLTNSGTIALAATARATGSRAYASASVNSGISQNANASASGSNPSGNASVSLTNSSTGVLTIGADAKAVASVTNATAYATVRTGISQNAYSQSGDASVALVNDGSLAISAVALASNTAGSDNSAYAYASVSNGIYQSAQAFNGGFATTALTNTGNLSITATATANANGYASASASISSAISQYAYAYGGGDASVDLTNSGALTINATANATGATATAEASLSYGISQNAYAFASSSSANPSGNASVTLTNSSTGILTISGTANALAGSGYAEASVSNSSAIAQYAFSANGDATASIVNDGAISIDANAKATSTGSAAYAYASVYSPISQNAYAAGGVGTTASVDLTNTGTLTIDANANALASSGYASASATVEYGIFQEAYAANGGTATVGLTNDGALSISANAAATGTSASAYAEVYYGIEQYAYNGGTGDANIDLTNSATGTIDISANAFASATAGYASAQASNTYAISQSATATDGIASATLTNDGAITIGASAQAIAATAGYASAYLYQAVYQNVTGSAGATGNIDNTGSIAISALADAAGSTAQAYAYNYYALSQVANSSAGNASLDLTNSGSVSVVADAVAVATGGNATATGYLSQAIYQVANAPTGDATVTFVNSSTFDVAANGRATSTGDAKASANISSGIYQGANASAVDGVATASITNSGTLTLAADAQAHGGTTVGGTGAATASAYVSGANQNVSGFDGVLTFNNSGTYNVTGNAVADGGDQGRAYASVTGVNQYPNATNSNTINFTNTSAGTFNVTANASATGGLTSTATAAAEGLKVIGSGPVTLAVSNAGLFNVTANATASNANAYAYGMEFFPGSGVLGGTISNAGTLTVAAVANGTAGSSASASGIYLAANANNVTLTNTGTIDVSAITNGGAAFATGISATAGGAAVAGVADVFTINNNGGTITARISTDGGATFQRGMAIDVDTALGQSVINFTGAGDIYGNVDVKAGDVINVFNGETSFDGVINPECLPGVNDSASATCGQGTLNIGAGGTLYLRDTVNSSPSTYDGPAYAFVDTFNVAATGTLALDLPVTNIGGAQPIGTYSQIFTNTANLGGTLLVRPDSPNGLYANNYFYDNVIDANVRNGTFANCAVDSVSPLLAVQCVYDSLQNVDLNFSRVNFSDVPGLTGNGIGVAAGLDCLYSSTLTGGIASLLVDLFTLNTPSYLAALQQLSGGSYASYLQSFDKLGVRYNDLIDHATDCEDPALAGSITECRTQPLHVWGQIQGATRSQRGDAFVGKVDGDQWTAMLGVDAAVAPAFVIGAELGKVTNRIDTDYGAHVRGDGYQVGAYGVFDPGNFYAKFMGTYSWLNGQARREVDFRPLGGTTVGRISASPDVRSWTAGAHFGYRIGMGGSVITPYVNFDHVDTKLKSFTEGGLSGANLTASGHEKRSFLTGGAKFGINVGGGAMLQADLGYQHMFGRRYAGVTTAFDSDPNCLFDSFSSAQKRDSIRAGLSLGGTVGPFQVRAAYDGLYATGEKTHAGSIKIVLPFGGARRR